MFNYHTHTIFCQHAQHTVDEMCEEAIKRNFSDLGFSEHYDRDLYGGNFGELPFNPKEYFSAINKAKEKYKGTLNILAGAEMDFYLYNYLDVYKEILSYNPDYILGSVHRIKDFSFSLGHVPFIYKSKEEISLIIKEYLGTVLAMVNSGCINSLSHFDIYKRSYVVPDESIYYPFYEAIAQALRDKNIALELNTHYNQTEFKYIPDRELYMWKKAKEYDIPVIVSSDCHSKDDLEYKFPLAFDFLKSLGIKTTCRFKNRKIIKEEIIY